MPGPSNMPPARRESESSFVLTHPNSTIPGSPRLDAAEGRPVWPAFACVFLVACAVRAAYLVAHIAVRWRISNADDYQTYAENILNFGVYGVGTTPTAWVPPGMALALAAVYKIFGVSFAAWAGFIIGINALTCCLIWDMARRVFGPREGLVAGLIAAVYPQFLYQTIHTDAKTIMLFGLCLGAWCLVREWQTERRRWIYMAGLAFGIAYLGRSQLLLLPAFLPIWAFLRYRPAWSKVRAAAAILVLSMGAIMMLWIGRNYLQFHSFIAGASGEGLPFAAVNNEANFNSGRLRGLNMLDTATSLFTVESGYVDGKGSFTQKFWDLRELDKDRLLKTATFDWIRHNPHKMAVMVLFKWKALWISPQNYGWPVWSRMFNIPLYLGVILPFAAVGAFYLWKTDRRRAQALLIWPVIALYITALHSVFEGEIRHRIAFEPGMIILAAAGLVYAIDRKFSVAQQSPEQG